MYYVEKSSEFSNSVILWTDILLYPLHKYNCLLIPLNITETTTRNAGRC